MVTTNMTRNMAMENFSGSQVTNIEAIIIRMKDKDMVSWNGAMEAVIMVTGKTECSMV